MIERQNSARRPGAFQYGPIPGRQSLRHFLWLFPTVLLVLSAIVYGTMRVGDDRAQAAILRSLETEERQAVRAMSRMVQQTLFTTTASLQYVVLLIERSFSEARPLLEISDTLLDFSRTHPVFDQIRFLDVNGKEAVRVDNADGLPRVIPAAELQDKSGRDYFKTAVTLRRGAVFITQVEFNRERGVLEYPLKPVIRLATPVFAANEELAGVAIVNYKARALLNSVHDTGEVALGNPNIISYAGRWLMETDPAEPTTYRINAPDTPGFDERYPEEWKLMQTAVSGSFRTENGLFSYGLLRPATLEHEGNLPDGLAWTVPRKDAPAQQGGWIALSHVPPDALRDARRTNRLLSGVPAMIIIGLVVLVAWFIALQLASLRARALRLHARAISDSLTGLCNRGEFDKHLRQAVNLAQRHNRPMAVMYIDVNDFKELNDTHGHASGDEVLIAIAARLVAACRSTDVVARLGGDEFALILWELSGRRDAELVANKMAAVLQQPLALAHGEYGISASIGVAVYPDDGEDPDSLLRHADSSMYEAKALSKAEPGRESAA